MCQLKGFDRAACVHYIVSLFFISLSMCWLSGCQESHQTRMEHILEAHNMQMMALSDRLAQCEHQWQTNVEVLNRNSEMALAEITAVRYQQNQSDDATRKMGQRWEEKIVQVQDTQKQIQTSIGGLRRFSEYTSQGLLKINNSYESLIEGINSNHEQLVMQLARLDDVSKDMYEKLYSLQRQTDDIDARVLTVHDNQETLCGIMHDSERNIVTCIDSVAKQQEEFQAGLNQAHDMTEKTWDQIVSLRNQQETILALSRDHESQLKGVTSEIINQQQQDLASHQTQLQELQDNVTARLQGVQEQQSHLQKHQQDVLELSRVHQQELERAALAMQALQTDMDRNMQTYLQTLNPLLDMSQKQLQQQQTQGEGLTRQMEQAREHLVKLENYATQLDQEFKKAWKELNQTFTSDRQIHNQGGLDREVYLESMGKEISQVKGIQETLQRQLQQMDTRMAAIQKENAETLAEIQIQLQQAVKKSDAWYNPQESFNEIVK